MRLLDLFCCGGLASWGYWRSGVFSEIVGVDIEHQPYAFDFIQGDALALDYDFLSMFDFIHASPPCQYYSKMTPDRSKHPRLIPPTLLMLNAAGKPFVVENVEGSGHDLRPNLLMTGADVGLPILRRRYFHCSWINTRAAVNVRSSPASHMSIDLNINQTPGAYMSSSSGANVVVHGGNVTRSGLIKAMGLDEMSSAALSKISMYHMEQGIPPAMTTKIIRLYTPKKFMIG